MKNKLSTPLLAALFVIITGASCSPKMTMQSDGYESSAAIPGLNQDVRYPLHTNDINAKVIRSFIRTFGEVPGAKWYRSGNNFRVTFVNNEMNHTVYYKQNGMMDAKILTYSEDRLPPQVRHLVKSRFYDFAISHVTEVHKSGATAFYVKVEDHTVIKTVKIVEEEWEVVESITKRFSAEIENLPAGMQVQSEKWKIWRHFTLSSRVCGNCFSVQPRRTQRRRGGHSNFLLLAFRC